MRGTYHWTMQKFHQWCVGGNGGVTRQPAMKPGDPVALRSDPTRREAEHAAIRGQPLSSSMTSLEWVTGSRLPSSSMRDPVTVSISSRTRTLTR